MEFSVFFSPCRGGLFVPPHGPLGGSVDPLRDPLTLLSPLCQTFLYSSHSTRLRPFTQKSGARSNNWANALRHDPSYRPRRLATEKDVMTSCCAYYGMCGIKQPEEDEGKPKIIKNTEINEVHGEPWSSRLSVRASSQPSPSLNGESDGYSLFFFLHPQAVSLRL